MDGPHIGDLYECSVCAISQKVSRATQACLGLEHFNVQGAGHGRVVMYIVQFIFGMHVAKCDGKGQE